MRAKKQNPSGIPQCLIPAVFLLSVLLKLALELCVTEGVQSWMLLFLVASRMHGSAKSASISCTSEAMNNSQSACRFSACRSASPQRPG